MRSVLSLQMPHPLLQHPSQDTCLSPYPSSLLSEWLVSVTAEHMAIWLRAETPTFNSISAMLMRLPELGFPFFCYPNNCHMRVLMHIGNYIPYISGFTNEVSHKYILLPTTIFKSARSQRGQSPRPGTMGGAYLEGMCRELCQECRLASIGRSSCGKGAPGAVTC